MFAVITKSTETLSPEVGGTCTCMYIPGLQVSQLGSQDDLSVLQFGQFALHAWRTAQRERNSTEREILEPLENGHTNQHLHVQTVAVYLSAL